MNNNVPEGLRALQERKKHIRAEAISNRRQQQAKQELSCRICRRLTDLEEYACAQRLLLYVGRTSEVQTDTAILTAWRDGKQVVVPCCVGDELVLFRVESMHELAPRTLGIMEPRREVCAREDRKFDVAQIDLIVAPGVAFDPQGGRVGHGKGFYDRLLWRARPDTPVVGLAFECQIFPEVPMTEHDVFVDKVITESRTYQRENDFREKSQARGKI